MTRFGTMNVAQVVWCGDTKPEVMGSIPSAEVKPSGPDVWGSPALFYQTVTSPIYGTFLLVFLSVEAKMLLVAEAEKPKVNCMMCVYLFLPLLPL